MARRNESFEANWWYVLGALVIGLLIPDRLNPVEMIKGAFDKDQKGKEKQQ